jgi:hypothetical protein
MAFDGVRGKTVLFGGYLESGGSSDETWTWDGSDWRKEQPQHIPTARFYPCMGYDEARKQVILFGGYNGGVGFLGDMWIWNGSDWIQQFPATLPTARASSALSFDSGRNVLVLHSGVVLGSFPADTWEWNGVTWVQRAVNSPTACEFMGLTYDPLRSKTLMFGGFSGHDVLGYTFIYDGNAWSLASPPITPPKRSICALAFLPARGKCVLFGGAGGSGELGDTWEWDGSIWTQLVGLAPTPPPRMHAVFAYDSLRQRLVMFGGAQGTTKLTDTWEYLDNWTASFGSYGDGCPGTAGTPALANTGKPILGTSMQVTLSKARASAQTLLLIGNSRTSYLGLSLPYNMGPAAPACTLLAAAILQLPLTTTATGTASVSLALKNDPSWLGLSFYSQYLVVDPGANLFGLAFSQGGVGVFGTL